MLWSGCDAGCVGWKWLPRGGAGGRARPLAPDPSSAVGSAEPAGECDRLGLAEDSVSCAA